MRRRKQPRGWRDLLPKHEIGSSGALAPVVAAHEIAWFYEIPRVVELVGEGFLGRDQIPLESNREPVKCCKADTGPECQ